MEFLINGKKVGENQPCFVIAEAGSNHNGSIEKAKELVDIAVEAKADAVKFQTFTADKLFYKKHAAHPIVKKFEFKLEWHKEIKEYCEQKSIIFMTTPFQTDAVDLLETLGTGAYKIASGDMDYGYLLDYISDTGKPVILSTGIAYMDEVTESVKRILSGKTKELAVLHCVANYPPKTEDVNLNVMKTMKETLANEGIDVVIGYSDHTMGISVPITAVAMGAKVIEKHFTMSRKTEGMDHFYALEPDELKVMIEEIRKIEKAMGSGKKIPVEGEYPERHHARRGTIAGINLKKGDMISIENIDFVRPVNGIEAKYYKMILGKKVKYDIEAGEPVKWEDLE